MFSLSRLDTALLPSTMTHLWMMIDDPVLTPSLTSQFLSDLQSPSISRCPHSKLLKTQPTPHSHQLRPPETSKHTKRDVVRMNNLALLTVIIFTVTETLGVGSIGGYEDIADGLEDLNSNLGEMKELLSSSLTSIDGEY